jgi:hypothetical protein
VFENRDSEHDNDSEKAKRDWRESDKYELHNLYPLGRAIREVRLRRMSWEEHVARMGDIINAQLS